MNNAWQRYLEAASGLTNVTQQRAEQLVKGLVKQGEVAAERTEKLVDELVKRSEQNRKAASALVKSETEKAVGRLGLARKRDIDRLERKIDQLEKAAGGGRTPAKKASKKRAKKTAAKRSAKKTAAKRTAKKAKKATKKRS